VVWRGLLMEVGRRSSAIWTLFQVQIHEQKRKICL
jgi:hypothetical protein